jgi:hypothetical protein
MTRSLPPVARVFVCLLFSSLSALGTSWQPPEASGRIHSILQAHWQSKQLPENRDAGDEVFLRRVYLDVAGRIPTVPEARQFLSDQTPEKRGLLIDRLLDSESYPSAFYPFWADILRLIETQPNTQGVSNAAYERYVKQSLRDNKPYDQWVRELLSSRGLAFENGAVGYYLRDRGMPLDNMAVTTRIFLGTRIECAQCHDHPFDKWKQTDFYKLTAFTYGNTDRRFVNRLGLKEAMEGHLVLSAASSEIKNKVMHSAYFDVAGQILESTEIHPSRKDLRLPHDFAESDGKPHEVIAPAPLFGSLSDPQDEDRTAAFARWVSAPENPRFTRVIVNRLWKKLFGAPLTDPLDALTDSSESAIPELEQDLERVMKEGRYDLKAFLRVLLNTRAYQSAALQAESSPGSPRHFQGPYLRRMTAEQIWDSIVALVSHEPEAPNQKRNALQEAKLRAAKTTQMAYETTGVKGVLSLALARVATDEEFTQERAGLMIQMEAAGRGGDSTEVSRLKEAVADLEGRWETDKGERMIMPLIETLAKSVGGPSAKPVRDELFTKPHWERAVRSRDLFRQYSIAGDPLAPKNKEHLAKEDEGRRTRWLAEADRIGIADKDKAAFEAYCRTAADHWIRAAELGNPAPRGHFLREMGQSDRELVENANLNAGMPQALLLMNGEIISKKGLMAPFSPLLLQVSRAPESERLEAVCLALFSRKPRADEEAVWQEAQKRGQASVQNLIFALLNAPQFLFVE